MRKLFLFFVFIFIAQFLSAQAPQPVVVKNWGTGTRDEVRKTNNILNKMSQDLLVRHLDGQTRDESIKRSLDSIGSKLDRSNVILQQQYDDRWTFQQLFGAGLLLLSLFLVSLWILFANYLQQPLVVQAGTPPVTNPTAGSETIFLSPDEIIEGDYVCSRAIVIKGNRGTVTVNVNDDHTHHERENMDTTSSS